MRLFITAFIALLGPVCYSQQVLDVSKIDNIGANTFYSVGGSPFVNAKFVRLKSGTPYFSEEWMKGKGLSANGKAYIAPAVRLNLLDDQIIFLSSNGTELIASVPLKQLVLIDTIKNKEYSFFHSSSFPDSLKLKAGWYLLLSSGKANLLVSYRKQMFENKPYGSATTEQMIATAEQYFIHTNGALHPVKKPKDIPGILQDKKADLEAYQKKMDKLDIPLAMQLSEIISYYNRLN